jgi:lysosomal alpha-mannosidase
LSGNDINTANKKLKADAIVSLAKQWNKDFGDTNQVLMTFGDDFKYNNAEHYFANLDKLVDAVHEFYPDVNILYSNPMCYLWSVHQLNRTFEFREKDYFPLWSGFFSSRPSLKRQERSTNNLLQIAKQLDAMTRIPETEPFLEEGRNEVAVMTHHDAITGTSPQATVNDYILRLFSASAALNEVIDRMYRKLVPKQESDQSFPKQIFCDRLNISECYVSETSNEFTLIVFNPIGRPVSQWLRIPIPSNNNYEVSDSIGNKVTDIHVVPISERVLQIPGRNSSAKYELLFKANLEKLGFVTYFIKKTSKRSLYLIENDILI